MAVGMVQEMEVQLHGEVNVTMPPNFQGNVDVIYNESRPIKSFGEHMAMIDGEAKDTLEDRLKHLFAQALQEIYEHNLYKNLSEEETMLRSSAIQQTVSAMDAAVRYVTHKDRF